MNIHTCAFSAALLSLLATACATPEAPPAPLAPVAATERVVPSFAGGHFVNRESSSYPYYRYGPAAGPTLPDKGEIVSEQVCAKPTITQVCRRAYELFPGAVWRYTDFSETERQFAEGAAGQFARANGGYVQHEGNAYVVYQAVTRCTREVTGCQSLAQASAGPLCG